MTTALRRLRMPLVLLAALAAAVALSVGGGWFTSLASAVTAPSISFQAVGAGSSAALATGTNKAGGVLAVSDGGALNDAQIVLNGVAGSVAADAEPTITLTGMPPAAHHEIVLYLAPVNSGDHTVFGYPYAPDSTCVHADTAGWCWSIDGNTYGATWAQVKDHLTIGGGLATAVLSNDVVSTELKPTVFTTDVTSLTWNGTSLLPKAVPNVVTAADICGNYANRLWTFTSHSGAATFVNVFTRLNTGQWFHDGSLTVPAEGSKNFITHRGSTLQEHYGNGLGGRVSTTYAAHTSFCVPAARPAMKFHGGPGSAVLASAFRPARPANTSQHTVVTRDQVYVLLRVNTSGGQFKAGQTGGEVFNVTQEGNVGGGYPFSDGRFNTLYSGKPVFEMAQSSGAAGCAGIDSAFHSGVVDSGCANGDRSLWVAVGLWFVSVGETDHIDNYPYGSVMFRNTNFLIYTQSHAPANDDTNQWGFG